MRAFSYGEDMIEFSKVFLTGSEDKYVNEAVHGRDFGESVSDFLKNEFGFGEVFLTHTATDALEMAAILSGVTEGDEVIMPSYTFVSTANAFALRGARIVFVDVDESLNMDIDKLSDAITERTKAAVAVHYGGISTDMERLKSICNEWGILLIEDAAMSLGSEKLGTYGDFSAISFHDTKNITAGGEGGCLVVNNESFICDARIAYEKGTDHSSFRKGEVSAYTWKSLGSSFEMGRLSKAFLYAQLLEWRKIQKLRLDICKKYEIGLKKYNISGCRGNSNGHMFFIFTADEAERMRLTEHLKLRGIMAYSHYEPLHLSDAGKLYGVVSGSMEKTENLSKRILRLPVYPGLTDKETDKVIDSIREFYND